MGNSLCLVWEDATNLQLFTFLLFFFCLSFRQTSTRILDGLPSLPASLSRRLDSLPELTPLYVLSLHKPLFRLCHQHRLLSLFYSFFFVFVFYSKFQFILWPLVSASQLCHVAALPCSGSAPLKILGPASSTEAFTLDCIQRQ